MFLLHRWFTRGFAQDDAAIEGRRAELHGKALAVPVHPGGTDLCPVAFGGVILRLCLAYVVGDVRGFVGVLHTSRVS